MLERWKFLKALEAKPSSYFIQCRGFEIFTLSFPPSLNYQSRAPCSTFSLPEDHLGLVLLLVLSGARGAANQSLEEYWQGEIQVKHHFIHYLIYRRLCHPSFEPTITMYCSYQGSSYAWRQFTSWSLPCQQFNHLKKPLSDLVSLTTTKKCNSQDCIIYLVIISQHRRVSLFNISVYIQL